MVHILDGKSVVCAHGRSNLCYLISLRHSIRTKAVTNRIFLAPKKPIYHNACATCSALPCDISTMMQTQTIHIHSAQSQFEEGHDVPWITNCL